MNAKLLGAVLGGFAFATVNVAFAGDKADKKTEKKEEKKEGKKEGGEKSCGGEKGCGGKKN